MWVWALCLSLALSTSVRAAEAELVVLFELAGGAASGCTVPTVDGPIAGIEQRLRTVIDLDTQQVVAVTRSVCVDPETSAFGPETALEGAVVPPWNVAVGEGTSGSTLIETTLPLSAAPAATVADVFIELTAPAGGDALLGSGGGGPIRLVLRAAGVPFLPSFGLALLGLALFGAAELAARRRPHLRRLLAGAIAALAAGPALVHAALGDGVLRAWSPGEQIAVDFPADAPAEADILAAFAYIAPEQDALFLRVDALLGPAMCLDWGTVDPGSGYSCIQEPPPDPGPFGQQVALTFDDGPNLATTPAVVATLRSEGIPATFFMLGWRLQTDESRALAREIHDDPLFVVANHSFDHPRFTTIPLDEAQEQIRSGSDAVRAALGDACYFPRFFRFPFSASNCPTMQIAREQGLSVVGRHLDTYDWCYATGAGFCAQADVPQIPAQYRNDMVGWVLHRLGQTTGGVVLMHDVHANTVLELPNVIAALRGAGATFVRLDDATVFPLLNAAMHPPEPPACCDGVVR